MAAIELTDEVRKSIEEMTLEDLRKSILVEVTSKSMVSKETAEFLLETYDTRLAELYW